MEQKPETTETSLQRTIRMRQLYLTSPSIKEWRLFFSIGKECVFSVGFNVGILLFNGTEESEASVLLNLGWLEIQIGIENNPY